MTESLWIVELDIRQSRARTTLTPEAGPCDGLMSEEVAGAAFTDGSNFADLTGEVGWSDFPGVFLEGALGQS